MGGLRTFARQGLLARGAPAGRSALGLVQGVATKDRRQILMQVIGLDGPRGSPQPLAWVGRHDAHDVSLAFTGSHLGLLSRSGSKMELRLSSRPGEVLRLAPGPGVAVTSLSAMDLTWSGQRLVASSHGPSNACGVAWAAASAGWLSSAVKLVHGSCNYAWLNGSGSPPARGPAGIDEQGAAVFYSVTSSGAIHRLTSSVNVQEVVKLPPPSSGYRSYRSFVARLAAGRVGALWVQASPYTKHVDSEVLMAVFDAGMKRIGKGPAWEVTGAPYALGMDVIYCAGRFIGAWSGGGTVRVWQLLPDGARLAASTVALGTSPGVGVGEIDLVCMEDGAAILARDRFATMRCPAPR
jgi:hypothetical protein